VCLLRLMHSTSLYIFPSTVIRGIETPQSWGSVMVPSSSVGESSNELGLVTRFIKKYRTRTAIIAFSRVNSSHLRPWCFRFGYFAAPGREGPARPAIALFSSTHFSSCGGPAQP